MRLLLGALGWVFLGLLGWTALVLFWLTVGASAPAGGLSLFCGCKPDAVGFLDAVYIKTAGNVVDIAVDAGHEGGGSVAFGNGGKQEK